jgi:PHD/YefM family antitoxin component YafN of YafNO toxin-antitoxin module
LKGLPERETFRIEAKTVKPRRKRKAPEIIMQGGKPTAVILSIEEYRDLLERLEDAEDLKMLKTMRKKPLKFRRLEDFLKESPGV